MILAGDVGGTKTNLAIYEMNAGKLTRVAERKRYVRVPSLCSEESLSAAISSHRRT